MRIKTFGPVDERSLAQLERCMEAGDAELGVLCADHHAGYSQPIGGGIAYEGHIPVGRRLRHRLREQGGAHRADPRRPRGARRSRAADGRDHAAHLLRHGAPARERVDHPVLDRIRNADFPPARSSPGSPSPSSGRSGPATTTST